MYRVYIETTIPSFYFNTRSDAEAVARCNWTNEWWDNHSHLYEKVTSLAVIGELEQGNHPNRQEKLNLISKLPLLSVTDEIREIVKIYIRKKIMPTDPVGDALHLAIASFHKCDILLSWNCQNLVNFRKFDRIRRLNVEIGLFVPNLLTPLELLEENSI
jgi:predicted nucleic acid-binding protein